MIRVLILICLLALGGCSDNDNPSKTYVHATGSVHNATISDQSRFALVASTEHATGLWDLKNNALKFAWKNTKQNPHGIIATAISAKAGRALTAEKHNIVLWDMKTGKAIQFWHVPGQIQAIAIDRSGNNGLMGYTDGMAEYIDLHIGQTTRRFQHVDRINDVAISPNGRYALTASNDRTAILWNIQTGEAMHTWKHKKHVVKVAFSPSNRYALTAASSGSVKLWDVHSGKLVYELKQPHTTVTALTFSPSEKYFVLATLPQKITLWSTEKGKVVHAWHVPKSDLWKPNVTLIYAVGFNANENQIWTEASNGNAYVWNMP